MTLILVRHGAYHPKDIDPKEGLSKEGISEVNTLRKKLIENNITFDTVYSSPKRRAFQTATILSNDNDIITTDVLLPHGNPDALHEFSKTLKGNTLFVGHNPLMGYLASHLGISHYFHTAECIILDGSKIISIE